jgi:hypothetical protein
MARKMNLEDMEDMEAMLRKQIEVLQLEVDRLNKEVMTLQILAGPKHEHDVWVIEKRNANEFKT